MKLEQDCLHGLPYFLVNAYQFFDCELFGRQLVFAQPKEWGSILSSVKQTIHRPMDASALQNLLREYYRSE